MRLVHRAAQPGVAIALVLAASTAQAEIDLHGKQLQLYGELHASIDYYRRGPATPTVREPSGVEITSNSSNAGFKGLIDVNSSVRLVWTFESEFDLTAETNTIDARDRYVGLSTPFGQVIIGNHNSPLKLMGSQYTLLGDTVGDRTGIFGQTATGDDQFNQRARSMGMYSFAGSGVRATLIYSPDFSADANPDTGNDGTSSRLTGAGIGYHLDSFDIAVSAERQVAIDGVAGRDASGYRAGISYRTTTTHVGGVFEVLKDDGYGTVIERNAWGVFLSWTIDAVMLAAQYFRAGTSASPAGDDGAALLAFGLRYNFNPDAEAYVVYARLNNDSMAQYQLARSGHGQAFAPTSAGAEIGAASAGVVFRF